MVSFGFMFRQGWLGKNVSFDVVTNIVLKLEDTNFDSIWLADHFYVKSFPMNDHFEAWVTLSAIAAITKKLRLGTAVTCNSYRQPSLLAKMSSTLDVISNGRLNFGIGAGWHRDEYEAYGIPFPNLATRVKQLREAITLIKKMWTEEGATFSGEYYAILDAINIPKPVQKPHPPVWIGGKSKKLQKVVAECADYYNPVGLSLKDFSNLQKSIDNCCDEIGRDPTEIKRCWEGEVFVDTNATRLRSLVNLAKESSPYLEIRQMPMKEYLSKRIIGTPQECIDQIDSITKEGATNFIMYFLDFPECNGAKTFSEEVIPYFSTK